MTSFLRGQGIVYAGAQFWNIAGADWCNNMSVLRCLKYGVCGRFRSSWMLQCVDCEMVTRLTHSTSQSLRVEPLWLLMIIF